MKKIIYQILLSLFLVSPGCQEKQDFSFISGVKGFHVKVEGDIGSPDSRLPFSIALMKYTVKIYAYGYDGTEPYTDFSGWVRLSSEPGIFALEEASTGPENNTVYIENGKNENVKITVKYAFGDTYIWVRTVGYDFLPNVDSSVIACSNGIDDDHDGTTDYPFDIGCANALDNTEETEELIIGVSDPIYFRNPKISDVQGAEKTSPLKEKFVTVFEGNMVVTRITSDGFFVTDIGDISLGYNSIYAFNFNLPENLMVCDRLLKLTGIVQEFYGFTELGTPSWQTILWDKEKEKCPVPDPMVLTATELADDTVMEKYESALVRLTRAKLGSNFTDCDYDGSGYVDYRNYTTNECSQECLCREACEKDLTCTELSQYKRYGQFIVTSEEGAGSKIYLLLGGTSIDFDPLQYSGKDLIIDEIIGTLRNVSFIRPRWIIEPRCEDDFVLSGKFKGVQEACVLPRTGTEELGY
jgi:hypothetical protein